MNRAAAFLTAPAYVLGELEADHTTIADLPARARAFRMAPRPELWGWGTIRRTRRSLAELAVESGQSTLRAGSIDPASIDAVILCSTKFPGGAEQHGQFVEAIMTGLGLSTAAFTGVTINRCTNLLAAIDIADAWVGSGRHRSILIVTADRVEDEAARMQPFALFSDGAASCVVTAETGAAAGYEVLCCASAQDVRSLDWSNEISADLAREVNDALLKSAGVPLEQIDGLLHSNLFTPLVVAKERQAGFSPGQLHTANITRVGHCFAADPLINLVDRAAAGRVRQGGYYILAASVPGSRLGVLVRSGPRNVVTTRGGTP